MLCWKKTAFCTREFDVFRCCHMEQLPLRIPSCSVQTIVQRLKKHLFISFYESMSGFSISDSLFLLLVLKMNTAHATMTFQVVQDVNFKIINRKHTNVWVRVHISKLTQYSTKKYSKKYQYICKAIGFITNEINVKNLTV